MAERSKGAIDGAIESTEDKVYNVYTENIKVEETRVDKGGKKRWRGQWTQVCMG